MQKTAFRAPAAGRQALSNLRRRLRDPRLAEATSRALQDLECELFLQEFGSAYRHLRETDPDAWAAEVEEHRALDGVQMDGLEDE